MQVYPFDVMVSIAQEDVQLGYCLDKYEGLTEQEINDCRYTSDTCMGRYVNFGMGASLLRIRKLPESAIEYGLLAHEIFHVASTILDRVGMKLEVNVSDEAYSYLIGYLTTEIYQSINKYYH